MGFANLPNQVHRKSVKKGFEFTLMVVGRCLQDQLSAVSIAQGKIGLAGLEIGGTKSVAILRLALEI